MFDIGFWELILIAVITLLVAGPERMPGIIRTVGLWVGKLRGFASSVRQDLEQNLAAEELEAVLKKQSSLPELQGLMDEASGQPPPAAGHSNANSATIQQAPDEKTK